MENCPSCGFPNPDTIGVIYDADDNAIGFQFACPECDATWEAA